MIKWASIYPGREFDTTYLQSLVDYIPKSFSEFGSDFIRPYKEEVAERFRGFVLYVLYHKIIEARRTMGLIASKMAMLMSLPSFEEELTISANSVALECEKLKSALDDLSIVQSLMSRSEVVPKDRALFPIKVWKQATNIVSAQGSGSNWVNPQLPPEEFRSIWGSILFGMKPGPVRDLLLRLRNRRNKFDPLFFNSKFPYGKLELSKRGSMIL